MRREVLRSSAEKPWLRGVVVLIALALVGVLAYRQVLRWRGGQVEVWVAAKDLVPGTKLAAANLKSTRVRERDVPAGAVRDRGAIVDKRLARAKTAGAPFFRNDFAPPDLGPGLAGTLPEGRVLMFLPVRDLPVNELVEQLRFGDRLDIVAFGSLQGGGQGSVPLVHDGFFVGWISERPAADGSKKSDGGLGGQLTEALAAGAKSQGRAPSNPLLLAVHPWEAVPLAEAQAAGAPLSLVLHGRSEVEKGKMLSLPRMKFDEIELIVGPRRESVAATKPR